MSPSALTSADWALLRLIEGKYGSISPEFWRSLRPDWSDRLRSLWESAPRKAEPEVLDGLRAEHSAQARPDLSRVHPSWFIRGLRGEAPSVQRAVVAHAPPSLREALRVGLGLSKQDLEPDHGPQPGALRWALALWTERLVADQPERSDDPPAVLALTRLSPRATFRLARTTGLVKWALSGQPAPKLRGREHDRFGDFERLFQSAQTRLRPWASRDLAALDRSKPHPLARLGIVTFARLLDEAEPYRVRWALQHVPYQIAKLTRSLMSTRPRRDPAVFQCESEVMRIAWDRLLHEGRLPRESGAAD